MSMSVPQILARMEGLVKTRLIVSSVIVLLDTLGFSVKQVQRMLCLKAGIYCGYNYTFYFLFFISIIYFFYRIFSVAIIQFKLCCDDLLWKGEQTNVMDWVTVVKIDDILDQEMIFLMLYSAVLSKYLFWFDEFVLSSHSKCHIIMRNVLKSSVWINR